MSDPFHIYPERVLKRAKRARGGCATTVRLDLRLDEGLVDQADAAAARLGLTIDAFFARAASRLIDGSARAPR